MSPRIILIEDELPAMEALETILEKNCSNIDVVGKTDNISDAFKLIKEQSPDIVITDIELQDKTIFDMLENIKNINFRIIFVTGHNDFAIKAFKLCAIDYLMKPVNEFELVNAIDKARDSINSEYLTDQIEMLKGQINGNPAKKIIFKTSDQVKMVAINDIIQLKASGSYTEVFIGDEGMFLVSGNLKEYENLLQDGNFFRSHQSHLINLNHFDYFHKGEGGYLVMNNKSTVPLSVKKKNEFFKLIETL